jgi:hypothetical protein
MFAYYLLSTAKVKPEEKAKYAKHRGGRIPYEVAWPMKEKTNC